MGKKVLNLDLLISKEIQYMIEKEGYKEGQALPSERSLAETFGVHRLTIRNAIKMLEEKGIILTKQRSGNYISPKKVTFDLNDYRSKMSVMKNMGIDANVKLLELETIKASAELAKKIMLPEGKEVFRITRLRYAYRKPMALERAYVNYELTKKLTKEDVHNKSLYDTLKRKFGIIIAYSNQKVTAVFANSLESELLRISALKPVMKHQGLVYDKRDRLILYFEDIMLMDKVEFISNR